MPDDVHEERAAVEVRVPVVELRERSRQIIGEDFVAELNGVRAVRRHAPRLRVQAQRLEAGRIATLIGRAVRLGINFLHVLGKIEDRVATRRPTRHLKIKRLLRRLCLDRHAHLERVRRRVRHTQFIADAILVCGRVRLLRERGSATDERQNEDEDTAAERPCIESLTHC